MARTTKEQIVEAAVRVIARDGVHGLSFARVVDEGGLSSTRLVSYHFGTRENLLRQTFAHVLARAGEFMSPRIAAEKTVRGKFTAYVCSNLEFIASDPVSARAAVELAANLPRDEGSGLELIEYTFRQGQESGELRQFDVYTAAVALRGAIDATVLDIVDGGADPDRAAAELSDLIDRAIRA